MGDVQATAHVFCKMKEELKTKGLDSYEDLSWFQNLTCARAQQELEKRSQE
jgi:DNA polymerase III alpha subunit (gram-positive type)